MKQAMRVGVAAGVALAVVGLALAGLTAWVVEQPAGPWAARVVRAEGAGVLGQSTFPPVLDGKRGYTTAMLYTEAVNVGSFGSVQVMAANSVTGSQVLTVTPQFSLQPLPCGSVTQWSTATTWLAYQPYSIASNSNTITETVGPWQAAPVIERFTVAGTGVAAREFSVQGVCLRLAVEFSAPSQRYTPTLVIRALNRY